MAGTGAGGCAAWTGWAPSAAAGTTFLATGAGTSVVSAADLAAFFTAATGARPAVSATDGETAELETELTGSAGCCGG